MEGRLLFPYAFLSRNYSLVLPSMLETDEKKLEMHGKKLSEIIARFDTEQEESTTSDQKTTAAAKDEIQSLSG